MLIRILLVLLFLGATTSSATLIAVRDEPEKPELTIEQRITLEAKANNLDPELAVRIARCESGLQQFKDGGVLRGVQNNLDVGVFQINEHYHLAASQQKGYDIHTIDGNIGYGINLMAEQGTRPWNWSRGCWGV
jgi:hypothetical protein